MFLDRETLSPETQLRTLSFPLDELITYGKTAPGDVGTRIADADIVITNKAPVRRDAIAQAPRLKLVAVAATGYDIIDVAACQERGISVLNIRNYAVNTVPEHTFALILALRRSILAYAETPCPPRPMAGGGSVLLLRLSNPRSRWSTLGIIGDGVLGQAVADIARGFGMRVLFSAYKGSTGMGPLYTPLRMCSARAMSSRCTLR